MPKFSQASKACLATVHPKLQEVFNTVIEYYDCKIAEGRRGKRKQNQYFREGKSKLLWPHGKHNVKNPNDLALAVDVDPWPIDFKNAARYYIFVGFVMGIATGLGITLRSGADWDGDWDPKDQRFNDLRHFELTGYVDRGTGEFIKVTRD